MRYDFKLLATGQGDEFLSNFEDLQSKTLSNPVVKDKRRVSKAWHTVKPGDVTRINSMMTRQSCRVMTGESPRNRDDLVSEKSEESGRSRLSHKSKRSQYHYSNRSIQKVSNKQLSENKEGEEAIVVEN